jgi:haloalkane dehalogenase
MDCLQTPDDSFEDLSGYPYKVNLVPCVENQGPHFNVIDVGPRKGRTVVLLHGGFTWSYSFRHMIPILAEAGCRVIVPDLIGFGRSDKPRSQNDHTIENHVHWLSSLVEGLDLKDVVLACQGEGAWLGLPLLTKCPERFRGLILCGGVISIEENRETLLQWKEKFSTFDELPIAEMVQQSTERDMHDNMLAGYEAPFPDAEHQAGPKAFLSMVADFGIESQRSVWDKLKSLSIPVITLSGKSDRKDDGVSVLCHERISTQEERRSIVFDRVGHLVQEERGSEFAHAILDLVHQL